MYGMCKCLLCETNWFTQAKHMKTTHTAIYSMYGMCHIFCCRTFTYRCILCEKICFLQPFPANTWKPNIQQLNQCMECEHVFCCRIFMYQCTLCEKVVFFNHFQQSTAKPHMQHYTSCPWTLSINVHCVNKIVFLNHFQQSTAKRHMQHDTSCPWTFCDKIFETIMCAFTKYFISVWKLWDWTKCENNFFKGNIYLRHMESTQEQYYSSPCHVRR